MDLVDYSEERFERDLAEFTEFATKLEIHDLTFIPVSALHGDNVVQRSAEHAVVRRPDAAAPPRARAHRLRPQPDRRPLPGAVRDPAASPRRAPRLPRLRRPGRRRRAAARRRGRACCRSGFTTTIAGIDASGGPIDEAFPPMSVTLRLADDLDVGRGDMLCRPAQPADRHAGHRRDGVLDGRRAPLAAGGRLIVQAHHADGRGAGPATCTTGSTSTPCTATRQPTQLGLNEIGRVRLRTTQPLFVDPYRAQPHHRRLHPDRRGAPTPPSARG